VVKLQEKVRQLESELAQYTEEDNFPKSSEDIVRVGGFVRLNDSDETPRYLGPSSGIAMTRLLMEEAKRYTDTKRISELIPEVRARRIDRVNRMQSVSFGNSISGPSGRRKSYPMLSAHPAQTLTTRPIADKLVEVFNTRGMCGSRPPSLPPSPLVSLTNAQRKSSTPRCTRPCSPRT